MLTKPLQVGLSYLPPETQQSLVDSRQLDTLGSPFQKGMAVQREPVE